MGCRATGFDDIYRACYTNVGIMNRDGQISVTETAVLGGELEADLLSMPGPVEDLFGYALYLAQDGRKHEQAKPPQRLRLRWCPGGCRGLGSKYISSRLHRTVRGRGVRAAHIPEEVQARGGHAQGRYRSDPRASQSS